MKTLRSWMQEGEFTLALSSNFFGFYSHCGFVAALYENGIRPSRVTGSSAGALVGAGLASNLHPHTIRDLLFAVKRADFWDPKPGLGFLRGQKFLEMLEKNFVTAFEHTSIPLEVAAFDIFSLRTRFLTSGPLAKAVAASCAVPLMFHPVRVGWRFYFDGGVFLKSGINNAHKNERVLCTFLPSAGWMGAYEWKSSLKQVSDKHQVLRLQGLPQVNPNRLETGKAAFAEAYKRTLKALDEPLQGALHDG